jgi:hypothetical protein
MKTKAKTKWMLATGAAMAALLLVLTFLPQPATLKLTGPAGLPFTGVIVSDGTKLEVSGILPADFAVTGHHIRCEFRKAQADGKMSLDVRTSGSVGGFATTSRSDGGVAASFRPGLIWQTISIGPT